VLARQEAAGQKNQSPPAIDYRIVLTLPRRMLDPSPGKGLAGSGGCLNPNPILESRRFLDRGSFSFDRVTNVDDGAARHETIIHCQQQRRDAR
jgi:hypothetical protein